MLNHPSATAFAVTSSGASNESCVGAAHQHRLQMGALLNGGIGGGPVDANVPSSDHTAAVSHQCQVNYQAAPWTLMGLMPQQSAAMHQQNPGLPSSRGGFFGDSSTVMPSRYPGVDDNNPKDHVNSTFYQFQDLDMIASIVAKEQAMLKVNSSGRNDPASIANLTLPHRHPQVIVNGARENLSSSPSDLSPTSCSPSSSDAIQPIRPGINIRLPLNQGISNAGSLHRQPSGNDSPIDVTGVSGLLGNQSLKQEPHFDMSGILGMGQINGHLHNINSSLSSDHILASTTSLSSSFAGLSYEQHTPQHLQQLTSNSTGQLSRTGPGEPSVSSTPMARSRHRSTPHDGLIKCHYCPKKWADQALLRVHMEECRVVRIHECHQCGKRFKARGGLQQHLRIHSNDRPYQCHYCPKRFTQKSHVDQHERIHTGAKPFSCQFCGRAFRQRSQQMGHEATHANGVLSVAASIASHQQLSHLNNGSPLNNNSEHHSPRTPEGASSGQQQQQQQQHVQQAPPPPQQIGSRTSSNGDMQLSSPIALNNTNIENNGNTLRIMPHNAVTSLLALSQGTSPLSMSMSQVGSGTAAGGGVMPPQTLASVLAARGAGV